MKDVQVKIATTVGGDIIGNLLSTAMGEGYWHRLPSDTLKTLDEYRNEGEANGDAMWTAAAHREQMKVKSCDGDEGVVSEFKIIRALQKIADEDPERMGRILDGQFDFEDADAFFQEVVFEDILFG